jgi:hypothetical protein
MGRAVGNFGEEGQGITKAHSCGFSPALSLENRTDFRQSRGLTLPLFGYPESLDCLLIVHEGFGKVVLYIVDLPDPKQFVAP